MHYKKHNFWPHVEAEVTFDKVYLAMTTISVYVSMTAFFPNNYTEERESLFTMHIQIYIYIYIYQINQK